MTAKATLLITEADGVVTVTLNRPDKLNALNAAVLSELRDVVQSLEARPREQRPRALIITGAGDRAFAAGADIAELSSLDPSAAKSISELGHSLGHALDRASFPSIAAVNGFALGGGLELALCCDLIVCSERARFGQPEINLGVIPGFGGTFRLMARVGVGHARRLIFTGEPVDAARAERIGLVDAVYPQAELLTRALELGKTLSGKAPLALASAKRCLLENLYQDFEGAAATEAGRFAELFATSDAREGFAAFLEKRAACFVGR
jgi:enoyl-CoA hydratase